MPGENAPNICQSSHELTKKLRALVGFFVVKELRYKAGFVRRPWLSGWAWQAHFQAQK